MKSQLLRREWPVFAVHDWPRVNLIVATPSMPNLMGVDGDDVPFVVDFLARHVEPSELNNDPRNGLKD